MVVVPLVELAAYTGVKEVPYWPLAPVRDHSPLLVELSEFVIKASFVVNTIVSACPSDPVVNVLPAVKDEFW